MADGYHQKLDMSAWTQALAALKGPVKESLARRMLVSGGVLLRDKAKAQCVRSDPPYNPNSRGSHSPGTLANSLYLAYAPERSTDVLFSYKISWNAKKAWWGKLVEFGYWRTHAVHVGVDGSFYTDMSQPIPPKWMPARPFLRPTFDSYSNVAIRAMVFRGQKELPILLQEHAPK